MSSEYFSIEGRVTVPLNERWTLRCAEGEPVLPLPAKVPGDVHSTLLAHGVIADPFYGTQAEDCRWVEDRTWVYESAFDWPESTPMPETARLVFHGLDTFAEVFVNEISVGRAANMFIDQEFAVADALLPGENRLRVVIDPVKAHVPAQADPRLWYSYDRDRVWARKAQFGWRWDWGPRLVTAGLWREVELVVPGRAEICSTFFRTLSVTADRARVSVSVEARLRGAGPVDAEIHLGDQPPLRLPLQNGRAEAAFEVPEPALWWTHDLGTPHLYTLEIQLIGPEGILDTRTEEVGIRTLELRQMAADGSAAFQFVLNGAPLFARGANWVPAHSFVGTVGDGDYRAWIDLARQGQMTMLRVWGGGLYEKPAFYRECDRQGLLVWQDFLFTCSSYPDHDPAFVAAVEAEIQAAVPRLRNHPCLALWCGNNEIEWIHEQKERERPEERLYGRNLWEGLFPRLLADLDPSRTYWPSSPFGGADPNGDDQGDKHNWQVWAGQIYPKVPGQGVKADNTAAGVSFRHFANDYAKFSSEFGMHAYPVRPTLEGVLDPQDLVLGSFGLRFRNKDKRPNRGRLLMEGTTGLPADLDQAIDFSMLAQAEGLRFGVEHYRRRRPNCSGALVWQLNDCWPTLSWSVVDFHRRPKAGYWALKWAFAPLLLSWRDERPDVVGLWVVNDTRKDWEGEVEIEAADFFGHQVFQTTVKAGAPAFSSLKAAEFSKNLMNITYSNFEYLAARPLAADPSVPSPGTALFLFEEHKDLNLAPATLSVRWDPPASGVRRVSVAADRFARMVRIEGDLDGLVLDENYFDLEPGRPRLVTLRGDFSRPRGLSLRAMNSPGIPDPLTRGSDSSR